MKLGNDYLIGVISDEEIKMVVFFTLPQTILHVRMTSFLIFFQKYWSLVGNSVTKVVRAFFHTRKLIKEINHTFITLIPKIANRISANHFRPICLYSTIYKIIFKTLRNRLKICLEKIFIRFTGPLFLKQLFKIILCLPMKSFIR